MKSAKLGKRTSGVEITNVSKHGFWLLIDDQERFVAFEHFPWFKDAPIGHLLNVELPSAHHLYWPDLDVDIAIESIDHPERFPLVSKVRSNFAMQRTRREPASRRKRPAAARR
jgi:hypothetical protein